MVIWTGFTLEGVWSWVGFLVGPELTSDVKVNFAAARCFCGIPQNEGGDLHHPMGRTKGIPTRGGSPSRVGNRTASLLEASSVRTAIR